MSARPPNPSGPLKVAYLVTRGDDIGGVQVHVRDLAAAMRAAGHAATVICGPPGIFTEELAERGIPFRCLPHLVRPVDPLRDPMALVELRGALRELQPDLIAMHFCKTRMLGCLAARATRSATVSTVHGWLLADGVPMGKRRFYGFCERQAARLTTAIVTVSHYDKELAVRHRIVAPERVTVVHNGMPDEAPRRDHDQSAGPVRLLMVGRHSPQKDHETLFRALALLRDKSWTLDLLGTGPDEPRHQALAREYGLIDRVHFLGYRKDVSTLMATADIYVLISNWEGLPLSIIEAMRAGLATVCSDVGGCRELVVEGDTGCLAKRGDAAAVARHLGMLIDSPDQRRRLGKTARLRFEQDFTFAAMFDRTVSVYHGVLTGRQVPSRQ